MEIIYPRIAGIDVGKREVVVALRTPGKVPGERRQRIRKYKTFYRVLLEMVAWLVEQGVTHVAMEATSVIRGANVKKLDIAKVVLWRTCL